LQNAPGEMDHGREGTVAGPARLAAVERDARTNEVVVIGSTEENAGGIGKARPRFGKSLAKRLEALALCLVLSVVRLVGTSEMTHQERKLEGGQQFLGGRDGVNVSCRKAKPVHAAVDVDGGGQSDWRRLCQCGPFLDLAGAVEHGTQGKPEIEGTSVFEQP